MAAQVAFNPSRCAVMYAENSAIRNGQQSQIGVNDCNKSMLEALHAIGTGRAFPVVAQLVYLCGGSSKRRTPCHWVKELGKEEEEKRMRKLKVRKIWISAFLAFLLAVLLTGCGDPDKGVGNPGDPLTPPTVTFVTPPDASTLVCPNTAVVTATFSKAMNPATINSPASNFTLDASGVSVPGQVTYNTATDVATFTPTASLAASTTFTATITTGVADTFGNTLAANFVWTFTTSAACPAPSTALGTACSFGILGGSTVTNVVGTATTVSGDVGVWPGSAITGFGPPASITGTMHAGDATAQTAQGDLTTAYNNAAGAAGGAVLPPDIGGSTLFPGVYKTTSAQPSLGITGNLTLDGQGDPNAIWIFQIVSTLDTAAGNSQVLLIGSAVSHNVFWQVGSSATLGTNTVFEGTIMAQASITLTTGATLNGRALARTGAVTLDTNTVVVPSCP